MTETVSMSRPPHYLALREDLAEQLRSAEPLVSQAHELSWVEFRGPKVEPRELLAILQDAGQSGGAIDPDVVVWESGAERWFGWGIADEVASDAGPADPGSEGDRYGAVRDGCAKVTPSGTRCNSGVRMAPRWFGGFSFDPSSSAVSAEWQSFGSGSFVLPRVAAQRTGEGATRWFLTLSREDCMELPASAAVQMLQDLWNAVDTRAAKSTPRPRPTLAVASEDSPARRVDESTLELAASRWTQSDGASLFKERIQEVVELIEAGGAQKIVAADQSVIALERSPRLDVVLEQWAQRAPESTRFLFCRGGVAFLGATPERLVQRHQLLVTSQALAGTLPKQAAPAGGSAEFEQRLLGNPKEQHEHEFVVRHIVEKLGPLCSEVTVEQQPRILELRDMLHLQTPVAAVLKQSLHVLDLVKALHPTPAVCGLPATIAQAWIREREVATRGWYSAPVGWFDAEGNGDFHVALRSMLLSPGSETLTGALREKAWTQARLFAGVGLVAGSVVDEEQREVATKLLTAGRTLEPWIRTEITHRPSESTE